MDEHAYRIPMPGLSLSIMLPRAFTLRIRVALMLITMASWFLPIDTKVEIEGARG